MSSLFPRVLIVAFSTDSKQAGCFWPIEIMPKTAQRIADFLPQRWVLDTVQKLQAGNSFSQILPNVSIILAFALVFFLIAAYRFGRNDSLKTVI
ncbi:MAG: ABC transporter permease [Carboxydocellales bacterium]